MVVMVIVSLNQSVMTYEELLKDRQDQLDYWNQFTIRRLAAMERAKWCMPSTKGRLTKTVPLSVIPQEDLHNIDITNSELAIMYNVRKMYIIQYRKENGINAPRYKSIEFIPLEELHNPYNSIDSLSKKYNVPPKKIADYRREYGISGRDVSHKKDILLTTNPVNVIPLEELHSPYIGTKSLAKKYKVDVVRLRKYRTEHNIKFIREYDRK